MSFDTCTVLQHYNPHGTFDQAPNYVDDLDCYVDDSYRAQMRLPPCSALNRYLQEDNEPRLFRSSLLDDDEQTLHPYSEHTLDRRLSSPISSDSQVSSYVSSGWSDRQESPHSPFVNAIPLSPQYTYNDGVAYAYGGHSPLERPVFSHSIDVCTMQDVQKCADQVSEISIEVMGAIPLGAYGTFAQEGYQPLQDVEDCTSDASCGAPPSEYQAPDTTYVREPHSPVIRRRRAQSRSGPSPTAGSRVSKRPHAVRSGSSQSTINEPNMRSRRDSETGNRAFPCPLAIYGCNSSFGSKNEWKRHVNTQHMRLGFWRCDQCTNATGDRKPNDFNRKDLFIQHVRRMHPTENPRSSSNKRSGSKSPKGSVDETHLQEAAKRCYKALRSSPEDSGCLFCDQEFHGRNTWDERMEHIGRHMETARKENKELKEPKVWRVDEMSQTWMAREQIIVPHGSNRSWVLATP